MQHWIAPCHNNDFIMNAMASQITGVSIVYLTACSGADQRKHQSSASLGIHRWPVNSPHKGPVTRKMFPFYDVIMSFLFPRRWMPLDFWFSHVEGMGVCDRRGGGTPSLRVSRYAPRFCPPFSASERSFCLPKFNHVYHFIQILVGPISETPIFRMLTIFLPPKLTKSTILSRSCWVPFLNFEWRTPTDFYPECPGDCEMDWKEITILFGYNFHLFGLSTSHKKQPEYVAVVSITFLIIWWPLLFCWWIQKPCYWIESRYSIVNRYTMGLFEVNSRDPAGRCWQRGSSSFHWKRTYSSLH